MSTRFINTATDAIAFQLIGEELRDALADGDNDAVEKILNDLAPSCSIETLSANCDVDQPFWAWAFDNRNIDGVLLLEAHGCTFADPIPGPIYSGDHAVQNVVHNGSEYLPILRFAADRGLPVSYKNAGIAVKKYGIAWRGR